MEMPKSPPLTILVVDDETDFANALAALLARDGHTVETADNGRHERWDRSINVGMTSSCATCACRNSTGKTCIM